MGNQISYQFAASQPQNYSPFLKWEKEKKNKKKPKKKIFNQISYQFAASQPQNYSPFLKWEKEKKNKKNQKKQSSIRLVTNLRPPSLLLSYSRIYFFHFFLTTFFNPKLF